MKTESFIFIILNFVLENLLVFLLFFCFFFVSRVIYIIWIGFFGGVALIVADLRCVFDVFFLVFACMLFLLVFDSDRVGLQKHKVRVY